MSPVYTVNWQLKNPSAMPWGEYDGDLDHCFADALVVIEPGGTLIFK